MAESRSYHSILCERSGPILTLTLNRPERKNPLSPQMINELLWALDDAKENDEVKVIVLTGAGKAFSAGADLKQFSGGGGGDDEAALPPKGDFADLLLRFPQLGKATIARIPGPAMGGGLGLVASCDFAIASDNAVLGTPEVRRGLFPMMIMALLHRLVPRRKLLEMMLLGKKLSADKALDYGLLTRVVPESELDLRVLRLAEELASQSPTAIRMGLAAFHQQADLPLEEAIPFLREQLFAILGSEDAREGLMSFIEKREPNWTGR